MTEGGIMPIRDFDPHTDYPRLAALYAAIEAVDQTGMVDASEEAIRKEHVDQRWIMDTPKGLLAHGDMVAQPPTRVFMSVAVHPQARRQGIGSALLQHGLNC